jgi:TPR repeat protein
MVEVLKVWKLLALADMKDVPYRRNQQLSSCYAMKLYLVQQLLRGFSHGKQNKRLFTIILQRFISKMPAALYQHALALVATGQCAAALIPLNRAIALKHLPSRALLAHMLSGGRKDVPKDHGRAFKLVKEGTELGCRHCQGVLAMCYMLGHGYFKKDLSTALDMAQKSSDRGSRYGQCTLGNLYYDCGDRSQRDDEKARQLFKLSAAQGLDRAQFYSGRTSYCFLDRGKEKIRLYQLAATQGLSDALLSIGYCYKYGGEVVERNLDNAICLFRQAREAGSQDAKFELSMLGE